MEIFMAFGLMGDPAHLLLENRQKISFRLVIEWTFSQKEKFFHPILWTVSPLPPPFYILVISVQILGRLIWKF